MDLVRLGLERGRTATEAIDVMIGLIEAHGQGGSGQPNLDWPYNNGFLACDRDSAWVLEASGRHWVARAVSDLGNISNHPSIQTNWDRIGADVAAFAVDRRWWGEENTRLNFSEAYRDVEGFSPQISENRYRRGSELLEAERGRIAGETMRAILRDHYDSGPLYRPGCSPDDGNYFSLCMHVGSLMGTTASMVARLPPGEEPPVVWAALGCPCTSVYLPYYLEGELPPAVSRGGKDPTPDSPWWSFRELLTRVEARPEELGPRVRTYWDAFEAEVGERASQVEARVADLRARGDLAGATEMLTDFMSRNVKAMTEGLRALEGMTA
jgi:dipeptidase